MVNLFVRVYSPGLKQNMKYILLNCPKRIKNLFLDRRHKKSAKFIYFDKQSRQSKDLIPLFYKYRQETSKPIPWFKYELCLLAVSS